MTKELVIFSGVDLYYGDACMLLHHCHWSEPQYNMLPKFCVHEGCPSLGVEYYERCFGVRRM